MNLNITLNAEVITIAKLSEESESNESAFIRKLCKDILQQFAVKTKDICNITKKMNLENPYGFPDL
ncbi:hypothetical protein [uncultured Treponema sp.]|uniref:hypothetical protein n=1 Tax=uncultured Treponema sp. TaxID=162155 RepID=UPI0015BD2C75|nr:hypothetical protein [uncultured Treponema sp.]